MGGGGCDLALKAQVRGPYGVDMASDMHY
jgi:hypothetical protein